MTAGDRADAPGRDRPGDELGRWRTGDDGRFVAMDPALRELVALPLVPVRALRWDDLVLPGTDLAFLELRAFDGCEVEVGVKGGVRRWALTGGCVGLGGAAGSVREVPRRVARTS